VYAIAKCEYLVFIRGTSELVAGSEHQALSDAAKAVQ